MQNPAERDAEVDRLRQTTRDLVVMSTLPAMWGELAPAGIIKSLAGVLLKTLDLDLACIRLPQGAGQDALEAIRCREGDPAALLPAAGTALDRFAAQREASAQAHVDHPAGGQQLCAFMLRFGIGSDIGMILVASRQAGFPSEHERLLLGVGANQAAMVLQRHRTEGALRQAEARQRALLDEVTRSNKNLSEFLAVLAHELRNPLAPILTGLEIMRMRIGSPEAVMNVRAIIERQVRQLSHLINDLLDIARVTNGKVDIRKESIDLKAVVSNAVETSLPLIEKGRHAFSLELHAGPLPVSADATRIAQVISNLLTNAAKYTPPGGSIRLSVEREGEQALVSVIDNGIGIEPESIGSVFEMFSQVGRNMQHSQGGLGIGLSLVRQLVDLHGGTVTASSEGAGKGSTFCVRLPLALDGSQAGPGEDAPGAAAAGKRFRILVTDDNVDAATTLASLLEIHGHEVRVAHDGPAALEIAAQFHPDVVFLDIGMPGMSGYEVVRRMRDMQALARSTIVAVSGWGAKDDLARANDAGFDLHFTKPVAPAQVDAFLGTLP